MRQVTKGESLNVEIFIDFLYLKYGTSRNDNKLPSIKIMRNHIGNAASMPGDNAYHTAIIHSIRLTSLEESQAEFPCIHCYKQVIAYVYVVVVADKIIYNFSSQVFYCF